MAPSRGLAVHEFEQLEQRAEAPTGTIAPHATAVLDGETSQQSEAAALHGRRALIPLIAGSVTGGTIGLIWIVGLLIYAYRRYKGHKAVRAAGLRTHRELEVPLPKPEAYIIPPDPAIIQGFRVPGERVVEDDPKADEARRPQHSRTVPLIDQKTNKNRDTNKDKEQRTSSAPQLSTMSTALIEPRPSQVQNAAPMY